MIEKLGRQYFNQVAKLTLPVIGESKSHATEQNALRTRHRSYLEHVFLLPVMQKLILNMKDKQIYLRGILQICLLVVFKSVRALKLRKGGEMVLDNRELMSQLNAV